MALDPIDIVVNTTAAEAVGPIGDLAKVTGDLAGAMDLLAKNTERANTALLASSTAFKEAAVGMEAYGAAAEASGLKVSGASDALATHTTSLRSANTATRSYANAVATADGAVVAHTANLGEATTAVVDHGAAYEMSGVAASDYANKVAAGTAAVDAQATAHKQLQNEITKTAKSQSTFASGLLNSNIAKKVAEGTVAIVLDSLYNYGKFQSNTQRLVAGAGELQSQLPADRAQFLSLMGSTGYNAETLTDAAYYINSSGYHGAQGRHILQAATQSAVADRADPMLVGKTLTTVLKNYGLSSDQAVSVANQLTATVAHGKTTYSDLATSLEYALPTAKNSNVALPVILGAMATMTTRGYSAATSAQYLRNYMITMSHPTSSMLNAQGQLGLDQQKVENMMGKGNIVGAAQAVMTAALHHMGKNGMEGLSIYKQSIQGSRDLATMENGAQGAGVREAIKLLQSGATSSMVRKLIPLSALDGGEWADFIKNYRSMTGFNSWIAQGGPQQQTLMSVVSQATGNKSTAAATMALGSPGSDVQSNINAIKAAAANNKTINGFAEMSGTLGQQFKDLIGSVKAASITLGQELAPAARGVVSVLRGVFGWFAKGGTTAKVLTYSLLGLAGAVTAGWAAMKLFSGAKKVVGGVKAFGTGITDLISRLSSGRWGTDASKARRLERLAKKDNTLFKDAEKLFGIGGGGSPDTRFALAVDKFALAVEEMKAGGVAKTLEGDLTKTLENDATKSGEKGLLSKVLSKVPGLDKFIGGGAAEEGAVAGETAVAAEGGGLLAGGGLMEGLGAAAAAAGPIALGVAGVAALGFGAYELYKHFNTVRHAVAEVGHTVAHTFDLMRHGAAEVGHGVAVGFDAIRHGAATAVVHMAHWASQAVSAALKVGSALMSALGSALSSVGKLVSNAFSSLWSTASSLVSDAAHVVGGVIHTGEHLVGDVVNVGKSVWDSMFGGGGSSAPSAVTSGGGTTQHITLNFYGVTNARQLANEIIPYLNVRAQINGGNNRGTR